MQFKKRDRVERLGFGGMRPGTKKRIAMLGSRIPIMGKVRRVDPWGRWIWVKWLGEHKSVKESPDMLKLIQHKGHEKQAY